MATAMIGSARGMHAQVDGVAAPDDVAEHAHGAVDRLVGHLENARRSGDPRAALGADNVARLMTASESLTFDIAE